VPAPGRPLGQQGDELLMLLMLLMLVVLLVWIGQRAIR
jgi:hypothetical protein